MFMDLEKCSWISKNVPKFRKMSMNLKAALVFQKIFTNLENVHELAKDSQYFKKCSWIWTIFVYFKKVHVFKNVYVYKICWNFQNYS